MSEARNEAQENARLKGIREARAMWQAACQYADQGGSRARVAEYLTARGIDVAKLRGGDLPPGLLYLPQCPCEEGPVGPAMIAAFTDDKNQITGVHRTFLHPDKPAKRDEAVGSAKMMRGACAGRVLRLWTGDYPDGVLVLAEGIETALAVHQATGYTVWPVGSVEGYRKLMLPAKMFWPRTMGGAGVHTLVMAADLNRPSDFKAKGLSLPTQKQQERLEEMRAEFPWVDLDMGLWWVQAGTGEAGAWLAGMRLMHRWRWLSTHMRAPGLEAGGLIERRGAFDWPKGGKGVDWLDVHNTMGPAVVKAALLAGLDLKANAARHAELFDETEAVSLQVEHERGNPVPQVRRDLGTRAAALGSDLGDGGGDGVEEAKKGEGDRGGDRPWVAQQIGLSEMPLLEPDPLGRARHWLWEHRRVPGQRRFGLAYWGGEWWVYQNGAYAKVEDSQLRSVIWHWMDGFAFLKGTGEDQKLAKVIPTRRMVDEVMNAMAIDTAVHGVVRMPAQLPAVISEKGRPLWGEASKFGARADSESTWAKSRIVFRNGVLDLSTLKPGAKVVLEPHSCEIFTSTALPFDLPADELQELVDHGTRGDEADAIFQRRCPKFYAWLAEASEADPDWEAQLQEMLGDTITQDRSIEKVFLVVGAQRAGKGILEDAIGAICGEDNVASTSFASLTADRFGLYPLLGKSVAVMPDAHLADFGSGAAAVEVLKAISGQGRVQVRDLYQSARTVKLNCRVWIFANEEPDLRDDSTAMANRLIVLPMRRSALGREDPEIKASVPREAAGIMLWALAGAIRLHGKARRAIDVCGGGRELAEGFESDSAPVAAFVKDWLVQEDGCSVVFEDLYDAYKLYMETEADRKPYGRGRFAKTVKWLIKGYSQTQPRDDVRGRKRVVHGAELKTYAAAELQRARGKAFGGGNETYMPIG